MRRRRGRGVTTLAAVGLLLAVGAAASDAESRAVGVAAAEPAGALGRDPRSTVVLLRSCADQTGERELTLFANGTVRLRRGDGALREMGLTELAGPELEALLQRLGSIDLSEVPPGAPAATGEWVESCRLELWHGAAAIDERRREFRYSRLDALPLPLGHLVQIANELEGRVELRPLAGLPHGYVPEAGDVLRRIDGSLFEVVGSTSDGLGLELRGTDQPLTLYIAKDALEREFVALERRRQPW